MLKTNKCPECGRKRTFKKTLDGVEACECGYVFEVVIKATITEKRDNEKCPHCRSIDISIERRLDGKVLCNSCKYTWHRKPIQIEPKRQTFTEKVLIMASAIQNKRGVQRAWSKHPDEWQTVVFEQDGQWITDPGILLRITPIIKDWTIQQAATLLGKTIIYGISGSKYRIIGIEESETAECEYVLKTSEKEFIQSDELRRYSQEDGTWCRDEE